MLSKKDLKVFKKIQSNAYILRKNYQIPSSLFCAIILLKPTDITTDDIKYLTIMSAKYMRIKYYYHLGKVYANDSKLLECTCYEELKEKGYIK